MFQPGPAISVSNRNLSRVYDTHPTIKLSQFRTPVGVFREETRFLYSQLQCLLELTIKEKGVLTRSKECPY